MWTHFGCCRENVAAGERQERSRGLWFTAEAAVVAPLPSSRMASIEQKGAQLSGHADSFCLRRSRLSRRIVAAVLTMVLLVAGSAVGCLAGSHVAEANGYGSDAHSPATAHHLPHERTGVTSVLELLSVEEPAGVVQDTADFHVDIVGSLHAGAEGCAHNIHDPRDETLIRVLAPDLQILHAAPGGLVRDSDVPVRVAGVQNASTLTPSIVQLSISRT